MSARMEKKDVIIVGGGPAGLAAAVKLRELGIRDILIVERGETAGRNPAPVHPRRIWPDPV